MSGTIEVDDEDNFGQKIKQEVRVARGLGGEQYSGWDRRGIDAHIVGITSPCVGDNALPPCPQVTSNRVEELEKDSVYHVHVTQDARQEAKDKA